MTDIEPKIIQITMAACGYENHHDRCPQTIDRFIIDPKTGKVIWLNETYVCMCTKRGCKCYTSATERKKLKSKTTRRKT